jgi:hypothetical protein
MAEQADWLEKYPGYGGRLYSICWPVCCLFLGYGAYFGLFWSLSLLAMLSVYADKPG